MSSSFNIHKHIQNLGEVVTSQGEKKALSSIDEAVKQIGVESMLWTNETLKRLDSKAKSVVQQKAGAPLMAAKRYFKSQQVPRTSGLGYSFEKTKPTDSLTVLSQHIEQLKQQCDLESQTVFSEGEINRTKLHNILEGINQANMLIPDNENFTSLKSQLEEYRKGLCTRLLQAWQGPLVTTLSQYPEKIQKCLKVIDELTTSENQTIAIALKTRIFDSCKGVLKRTCEKVEQIKRLPSKKDIVGRVQLIDQVFAIIPESEEFNQSREGLLEIKESLFEWFKETYQGYTKSDAIDISALLNTGRNIDDIDAFQFDILESCTLDTEQEDILTKILIKREYQVIKKAKENGLENLLKKVEKGSPEILKAMDQVSIGKKEFQAVKICKALQCYRKLCEGLETIDRVDQESRTRKVVLNLGTTRTTLNHLIQKTRIILDMLNQGNTLRSNSQVLNRAIDDYTSSIENDTTWQDQTLKELENRDGDLKDRSELKRIVNLKEKLSSIRARYESLLVMQGTLDIVKDIGGSRDIKGSRVSSTYQDLQVRIDRLRPFVDLENELYPDIPIPLSVEEVVFREEDTPLKEVVSREENIAPVLSSIVPPPPPPPPSVGSSNVTSAELTPSDYTSLRQQLPFFTPKQTLEHLPESLLKSLEGVLTPLSHDLGKVTPIFRNAKTTTSLYSGSLETIQGLRRILANLESAQEERPALEEGVLYTETQLSEARLLVKQEQHITDEFFTLFDSGGPPKQLAKLHSLSKAYNLNFEFFAAQSLLTYAERAYENLGPEKKNISKDDFLEEVLKQKVTYLDLESLSSSSNYVLTVNRILEASEETLMRLRNAQNILLDVSGLDEDGNLTDLESSILYDQLERNTLSERTGRVSSISTCQTQIKELKAIKRKLLKLQFESQTKIQAERSREFAEVLEKKFPDLKSMITEKRAAIESRKEDLIIAIGNKNRVSLKEIAPDIPDTLVEKLFSLEPLDLEAILNKIVYGLVAEEITSIPFGPTAGYTLRDDIYTTYNNTGVRVNIEDLIGRIDSAEDSPSLSPSLSSLIRQSMTPQAVGFEGESVYASGSLTTPSQLAELMESGNLKELKISLRSKYLKESEYERTLYKTIGIDLTQIEDRISVLEKDIQGLLDGIEPESGIHVLRSDRSLEGFNKQLTKASKGEEAFYERYEGFLSGLPSIFDEEALSTYLNLQDTGVLGEYLFTVSRKDDSLTMSDLKKEFARLGIDSDDETLKTFLGKYNQYTDSGATLHELKTSLTNEEKPLPSSLQKLKEAVQDPDPFDFKIEIQRRPQEPETTPEQVLETINISCLVSKIKELDIQDHVTKAEEEFEKHTQSLEDHNRTTLEEIKRLENELDEKKLEQEEKITALDPKVKMYKHVDRFHGYELMEKPTAEQKEEHQELVEIVTYYPFSVYKNLVESQLEKRVEISRSQQSQLQKSFTDSMEAIEQIHWNERVLYQTFCEDTEYWQDLSPVKRQDVLQNTLGQQSMLELVCNSLTPEDKEALKTILLDADSIDKSERIQKLLAENTLWSSIEPSKKEMYLERLISFSSASEHIETLLGPTPKLTTEEQDSLLELLAYSFSQSYWKEELSIIAKLKKVPEATLDQVHSSLPNREPIKRLLSSVEWSDETIEHLLVVLSKIPPGCLEGENWTETLSNYYASTERKALSKATTVENLKGFLPEYKVALKKVVLFGSKKSKEEKKYIVSEYCKGFGLIEPGLLESFDNFLNLIVALDISLEDDRWVDSFKLFTSYREHNKAFEDRYGGHPKYEVLEDGRTHESVLKEAFLTVKNTPEMDVSSFCTSHDFFSEQPQLSALLQQLVLKNINPTESATWYEDLQNSYFKELAVPDKIHQDCTTYYTRQFQKAFSYNPELSLDQNMIAFQRLYPANKPLPDDAPDLVKFIPRTSQVFKADEQLESLKPILEVTSTNPRWVEGEPQLLFKECSMGVSLSDVFETLELRVDSGEGALSIEGKSIALVEGKLTTDSGYGIQVQKDGDGYRVLVSKDEISEINLISIIESIQFSSSSSPSPPQTITLSHVKLKEQGVDYPLNISSVVHTKPISIQAENPVFQLDKDESSVQVFSATSLEEAQELMESPLSFEVSGILDGECEKIVLGENTFTLGKSGTSEFLFGEKTYSIHVVYREEEHSASLQITSEDGISLSEYHSMIEHTRYLNTSPIPSTKEKRTLFVSPSKDAPGISSSIQVSSPASLEDVYSNYLVLSKEVELLTETKDIFEDLSPALKEELWSTIQEAHTTEHDFTFTCTSSPEEQSKVDTILKSIFHCSGKDLESKPVYAINQTLKLLMAKGISQDTWVGAYKEAFEEQRLGSLETILFPGQESLAKEMERRLQRVVKAQESLKTKKVQSPKKKAVQQVVESDCLLYPALNPGGGIPEQALKKKLLKEIREGRLDFVTGVFDEKPERLFDKEELPRSVERLVKRIEKDLGTSTQETSQAPTSQPEKEDSVPVSATPSRPPNPFLSSINALRKEDDAKEESSPPHPLQRSPNPLFASINALRKEDDAEEESSTLPLRPPPMPSSLLSALKKPQGDGPSIPPPPPPPPSSSSRNVTKSSSTTGPFSPDSIASETRSNYQKLMPLLNKIEQIRYDSSNPTVDDVVRNLFEDLGDENFLIEGLSEPITEKMIRLKISGIRNALGKDLQEVIPALGFDYSEFETRARTAIASLYEFDASKSEALVNVLNSYSESSLSDLETLQETFLAFSKKDFTMSTLEAVIGSPSDENFSKISPLFVKVFTDLYRHIHKDENKASSLTFCEGQYDTSLADDIAFLLQDPSLIDEKLPSLANREEIKWILPLVQARGMDPSSSLWEKEIKALWVQEKLLTVGDPLLLKIKSHLSPLAQYLDFSNSMNIQDMIETAKEVLSVVEGGNQTERFADLPEDVKQPFIAACTKYPIYTQSIPQEVDDVVRGFSNEFTSKLMEDRNAVINGGESTLTEEGRWVYILDKIEKEKPLSENLLVYVEPKIRELQAETQFDTQLIRVNCPTQESAVKVILSKEEVLRQLQWYREGSSDEGASSSISEFREKLNGLSAQLEKIEEDIQTVEHYILEKLENKEKFDEAKKEVLEFSILLSLNEKLASASIKEKEQLLTSSKNTESIGMLKEMGVPFTGEQLTVFLESLQDKAGSLDPKLSKAKHLDLLIDRELKVLGLGSQTFLSLASPPDSKISKLKEELQKFFTSQKEKVGLDLGTKTNNAKKYRKVPPQVNIDRPSSPSASSTSSTSSNSSGKTDLNTGVCYHKEVATKLTSEQEDLYPKLSQKIMAKGDLGLG